mgnify:CR=1 FL=1
MRLAICYIQTGNPEEAKNIIRQLEDMEEERDRGRYKYNIGLIYANLDEKEKAVQYLKTAHREGYPFNARSFHNSFELIPLHGYPPYEEFVAPKGQ